MIDGLVEQVLGGRRRAVARAISLIENDGPEARAVLARAEQLGLTFLTGEPFYTEDREAGGHHIRLPFSYVEPSELARGAEILAQAIRQSG